MKAVRIGMWILVLMALIGACTSSPGPGGGGGNGPAPDYVEAGLIVYDSQATVPASLSEGMRADLQGAMMQRRMLGIQALPGGYQVLVKAFWKPVSGADNYRVYLRERGKDWTEIALVAGTQTEWNISDVLPQFEMTDGKVYEVGIAAVTKGQNGAIKASWPLAMLGGVTLTSPQENSSHGVRPTFSWANARGNPSAAEINVANGQGQMVLLQSWNIQPLTSNAGAGQDLPNGNYRWVVLNASTSQAASDPRTVNYFKLGYMVISLPKPVAFKVGGGTNPPPPPPGPPGPPPPPPPGPPAPPPPPPPGPPAPPPPPGPPAPPPPPPPGPPGPPPPPPGGSEVSGTVSAPSGTTVDGTFLTFCPVTTDNKINCESPDKVTTQSLTTQKVASIAYKANLKTGRWIAFADKDVNGDGKVFGNGDYFGCYGQEGNNCTILEPPKTGVNIQMTIVGGGPSPPPPPPPPPGNGGDVTGTLSAPTGVTVDGSLVMFCPRIGGKIDCQNANAISGTIAATQKTQSVDYKVTLKAGTFVVLAGKDTNRDGNFEYFGCYTEKPGECNDFTAPKTGVNIQMTLQSGASQLEFQSYLKQLLGSPFLRPLEIMPGRAVNNRSAP